MSHNRVSRSLRTIVLWSAGVSFLCFIVLFTFVLYSNMSKMLLRAESGHLMEIRGLVRSALLAEFDSLRAETRTWSSRDEAYIYALGGYGGFIRDNFEDGALLSFHGIDYVIIKDGNQNDIYTGTRPGRPDGGELNGVPAELSLYLNDICRDVMDNHSKKSTVTADYNGPYSDTGFVVVDGRAYLVCVMPILRSDESGSPSGTLAFAVSYGNRQLKDLTGLEDAQFFIRKQNPGNSGTKNLIEIIDGETVCFRVVVRNLGNDRNAVLDVNVFRRVYVDGMSLVQLTTESLVLILLVVLAVLFAVTDRLLLKPLSKLTWEVSSIDNNVMINAAAYSKYSELYTLADAINTMHSRLDRTYRLAEESKISLDVFTNILNRLDAYLYVSDPDTDEILFINDHMIEHFGIKGKGVGETCWQILQEGQLARCEFCPCIKLARDSETPVVWEEHNTITKRYYRNTDTMIDWFGGRRVHLQHSVDITDIKRVGFSLEKRLKQQEIMAAISQGFLGSGDVCGRVEQALETVGEFMDADRVLLARYNSESGAFTIANEWFRPDTGLFSDIGSEFAPNAEQQNLLTRLINQEIRHLSSNRDNGVKIPLNPLLQSYLIVPVRVDGNFWGVVHFGRISASGMWSTSNIALAELLASILAGVMSRKGMELQLKMLSSIVECSPQYIFYASWEGNMLYANPATLANTGYTPEEIVSGGLALIYDSETVDRILHEFIPYTKEHRSGCFEMQIKRKDGEMRIMEMTAFIMSAEDNRIAIIAKDITETRRLAGELIAAKELAERGSRAKSEFLSRMSHEMRTPMNAIIGMTHIARDSDDIAKKEYCLEKIDNASKHLLGVINDILDMSKIEADKFELSYSEFQLDRVLMNAINFISFRMDEKKQRIHVSVDRNLPNTLINDEQRLGQVITNLLSNAVKFTPQNGNVELRAELVDRMDDKLTVRISVKDDGIGITPEQQSRLFNSFEQADGSIARKFGGTGLGLVISKRIVEMMGGEFTVESAEGSGSTFSFTMQAKCVGNSQLEAFKSRMDGQNIKLLAVDDSAESIEYFSCIINGMGIPCTFAASGREAIETIRNAGTPFDMIFVDWSMPDMDGIAFTKALRAMNNDHTVVVMVSIAEWSEIEREASAAGVDDFIPKPLFPSIVMDCINRHMGGVTATKSEEETDYRFENRYVLIAEDVDINREIVTAILDDTGIGIDIAENGYEAVELFEKNSDRYDLILMDVHMPGMDGLEAARRIRASGAEVAGKIPIIAMTANVFREDVEECMKAGMNDHIGKPIDFDELLGKLAKHLNH